MFGWWDALDTTLKVLYCIAIPATLVLVIQTVMMLVGFGDGDMGIDGSDVSGLDLDATPDIDLDLPDDISPSDFTDGGNPADFGSMRLITLQTIIAFLTVFGWSSIVTLQSGGKLVGALIIGVVLGLLAMFLLAKLVQVSSKLAQNGTLDLRYALGQSATVYLPIPPENQGMGKVTLTLSERFTECDAITDDKEPITVGTTVRVIDLRDGVLVVEKQ